AALLLTSWGGGIFLTSCSGDAEEQIPEKERAEVTVPDGTTSIAKDAYRNYTKMTSITIPASVTEIGENAFENCPVLTNITVAEDNSHYSAENGILYNKDKTELLAYPSAKGEIDLSGKMASTVTTIGRYAFNGTALTAVTIPDGVKTIDKYAFKNCASLAGVTIPDSVEIIEFGAFRNCTGLASISIPKNVNKTTHHQMFVGCISLANITVADDNPMYTVMTADSGGSGTILLKKSDPTQLYAWPSAKGAAKVPDGITRLENNSLRGCTELESITIPDTVTLLGENVFTDCDKLTAINENGLSGTWVMLYNNIEQKVFSPLTLDTIKSVTDSYKFKRISEENAEGVEITDNYALKIKDGELTEAVFASGAVTIPAEVTEIADNAFSGCTALTSVAIPASVTTIAGSAFRGCVNLAKFEVAAGNANFSSSADGTMLLDKAGTTLCAYPSASGDNSGEKIPSAVTTIGKEAFRDCKGLTSITIPATVTKINEKAFLGCTNLQSITIHANVKSIGYGVCAGCTKLTDITVNPSNSGYCAENGILYNKDKTELIVYPTASGDVKLGEKTASTVTTIGREAFRDCKGLTNIIIPANVKTIDRNAFLNCNGLVNVTISEGVESIKGKAFQNCTALPSVTIPASVTEIQAEAFLTCSNLQTVSYAGTQAQWEKADIQDKAFPSNITITYAEN
ncbi:MAG: leucine-rich repeat domain-containing protein, partial [Treponema brennaborense]|nr:leucine-rich repeat domain-containing protein [Treponema brennaborense]